MKKRGTIDIALLDIIFIGMLVGVILIIYYLFIIVPGYRIDIIKGEWKDVDLGFNSINFIRSNNGNVQDMFYLYSKDKTNLEEIKKKGIFFLGEDYCFELIKNGEVLNDCSEEILSEIVDSYSFVDYDKSVIKISLFKKSYDWDCEILFREQCNSWMDCRFEEDVCIENE